MMSENMDQSFELSKRTIHMDSRMGEEARRIRHNSVDNSHLPFLQKMQNEQCEDRIRYLEERLRDMDTPENLQILVQNCFQKLDLVLELTPKSDNDIIASVFRIISALKSVPDVANYNFQTRYRMCKKAMKILMLMKTSLRKTGSQ